MSEHVVVDGRVFETEAADRGMGRYVAHLVDLLQDGACEVTLLMPRMARKPPGLAFARVEVASFADDPMAWTAELDRLLARLCADAYVDATPFLAPLRYDLAACPVVAVLYDLIPMRYPRDYFATFAPGALDAYVNGLARVKKADHVVAISGFVKLQALRYLGVPRDRCTVIEPAVGDAYRTYPPSPFEPANDAGVFCIQGAHRSKNFPAAIGFIERLSRASACPIDVVVPTPAQRGLVDGVRDRSVDTVRVAHSITEERKFALQSGARAIAHLSLEEGYGIPLAEALYLYRPIVCLDIPANRELTGDADEAAVAGVLLLSDPTLASDDALRTAAAFVREGPARGFVTARRRIVEKLLVRHDTAGERLAHALHAAQESHAKRSGRRELAIVAPMELGACGVSDYSHALMRGETPRFVLLLGHAPRAVQLLPQLRLVPFELLDEIRPRCRGVLVNLAVSDSIVRGFEAIARGSSEHDVLVVHDAGSYLPGLLMQVAAGADSRPLFERYLQGESEGVVAAARRWLALPEMNAAAAALFLEIDREYRSAWLAAFRGRIFCHHAAFAAPEGSAERAVLALLSPHSEILSRARYVPMPIDARASPAIGRLATRLRFALSLEPDDLLVCCAGSIVRGKHLDVVARVVAGLHRARGGRIVLLLAGRVLEPAVFADVRGPFAAAGATDRLVQIVEDDETRYDALLTASDVVIAFREQRRIQMSHSYVRALALGRPVVTNEGAGFDDLDAAAVCRDDELGRDLERHLLALWESPDVRLARSFASQARYRMRHTLDVFFTQVADANDVAAPVEAH